MALSISKTKSKGGRPRTDATPVLVRLRPEQLAALDEYSATADDTSRPQAIRAILTDWLRTHGFLAADTPKPTGPATEAVEAMEKAIKQHRKSSARAK